MQSRDQYPLRRDLHFRTSVRILAGLVFLTIIAGGLEIGLRLWSRAANADDIARHLTMYDDAYRQLYSPEELQSEPLRQDRCVRRAQQHWDPRFGLAAKTLDKACAKELFQSAKTKVVLFGGSAMDGAFSPNYLTTIEHYAFAEDGNIVSINLAEAAARLSNMLARLLHEVIELRPNVAVFLVGLNEFLSIQYGGLPGDDFFWATHVNRKVNHPMLFFLDKAIDESKLAQTVLIQTGIFPSPRRIRTKIDLTLVNQDVDYYFHTQEYTSVLCRQYSIKCIFILQPTPLVQSNLDARDQLIVQDYLKYIPLGQEIIRRGYGLLKMGRNGNFVLDPSRLFDGVPDAYFDVDHFTKVGNALLGKYIHDTILQSETRGTKSSTF